MKKSIDISKEQYSLLNRYIGQGDLDSPVTFFGNEPGTSGPDISETLKFIENNPRIEVGSGFMLKEAYAHPTTSDFARFISRLCLGIRYKDDRWFDNLSSLGKVTLAEHIMAPACIKHHSLVNLRPLPRPSENSWDYSNINKKDYLRKWNFTLKGHYSDPEKEERISILKEFFDARTGVVIGVGDRHNKKEFFELLYPEIIFHKAELDNHNVYFSIEHKIILSNYFNNRNGIKLSGLKDLYYFITSRNLITCPG